MPFISVYPVTLWSAHKTKKKIDCKLLNHFLTQTTHVAVDFAPEINNLLRYKSNSFTRSKKQHNIKTMFHFVFHILTRRNGKIYQFFAINNEMKIPPPHHPSTYIRLCIRYIRENSDRPTVLKNITLKKSIFDRMKMP